VWTGDTGGGTSGTSGAAYLLLYFLFAYGGRCVRLATDEERKGGFVRNEQLWLWIYGVLALVSTLIAASAAAEPKHNVRAAPDRLKVTSW
jgi:hypothetical protein